MSGKYVYRSFVSASVGSPSFTGTKIKEEVGNSVSRMHGCTKYPFHFPFFFVTFLSPFKNNFIRAILVKTEAGNQIGFFGSMHYNADRIITCILITVRFSHYSPLRSIVFTWFRAMNFVFSALYALLFSLLLFVT